MREIRTSGLMSGEGKRTARAAPRLSSTLLCICGCILPFVADAVKKVKYSTTDGHRCTRMARSRRTLFGRAINAFKQSLAFSPHPERFLRFNDRLRTADADIAQHAVVKLFEDATFAP